MATPVYQGQGQPTAEATGGVLGRLGAMFGNGGTPRYIGVGQPTTSAGTLGSSAVAYAPAPIATKPDTAPQGGLSDDEANAFMTCPIDPEALASGHIAIVIPRERFGPFEP